MNTRYLISMLITILILSAPLTGAAVVIQPQEKIQHDQSINLTIEPISVQSNVSTYSLPQQISAKPVPLPLFNRPIFSQQGNQGHPALARSLGGVQLAACTDEQQETVLWSVSKDDGCTYQSPILFEVPAGNKYPSVCYQHPYRFIGTMLPSYEDNEGGVFYTLDIFTTDALRDASLNRFITFRPQKGNSFKSGYYNFQDIELATVPHAVSSNWGFGSFVSWYKTPDSIMEPCPRVNIPGVVFPVSDDEIGIRGYFSGQYNENYHYLKDFVHTDAAIDSISKDAWSIYERHYAPEAHVVPWDLYVLRHSMNNWLEEGEVFRLWTDKDFSNPVIAAHDNHLIILVEIHNAESIDLVCLHGTDITTLTPTYLVHTKQDEQHPQLSHIDKGMFVCTFIKNSVLYKLITNDYGQTWTEPAMVDENIVAEYKSTVICDYGAMTSYEKKVSYEDSDIWIDTTFTTSKAKIHTSDALHFDNVRKGGMVQESFDITNKGDPSSSLNWRISGYPNWGDWSCDPVEGDDLAASQSITIMVTVKAPEESNREFTGDLIAYNKENPSDIIRVPVALQTRQSFQNTHPPSNKGVFSLLQQCPLLSFLQLCYEKVYIEKSDVFLSHFSV